MTDTDPIRPLVWCSMVYACKRGHEERIHCGVGVEGPPDLRGDEQAWAENRIIPSPFQGPRCRECGGLTSHVRWKEDEEFEPRPAESGDLCFLNPGPKIVERNERRYGGSTFLGTTWRIP